MPGLFLVFLITILPARRFIAFNPWGLAKNWHPVLLALLILGLYVSTFALFSLAQGVLDVSPTGYWLIKFAAFLIVMAFLAAKALPARLRSPNFLIGS